MYRCFKSWYLCLDRERQIDIVEAPSIALVTLFILLYIFRIHLFSHLWFTFLLSFMVFGIRQLVLIVTHGYIPNVTTEEGFDEKFLNELQYQVERRGYHVRYYLVDDRFRKRTDAPKVVWRLCFLVAVCHLLVNPCWYHKDLEDEQYPTRVDSESEIDTIWNEQLSEIVEG